MGRRSTKDNKNIFQLSRENAGLTREAAADSIEFISARRIESIENDLSSVHPDEVIPLASCYGDALLCNRYCSTVCPIGKDHVPEITPKSLQEITIEMLAGLNRLTASKERLIEIAEDGIIHPDEQPDFEKICGILDKMSVTIETLRVWAASMSAPENNSK